MQLASPHKCRKGQLEKKLFLKKLKIELPYDPAIPLLGVYLKETKSLSRRDICTHKFIIALFAIIKTWKQPMCSSRNEWMKKIWCYVCVCIHTHTHTHIYMHTMDYFSVINKNEILLLGTAWMNPKWNKWTLSEISQTKKDKYSRISLKCEI